MTKEQAINMLGEIQKIAMEGLMTKSLKDTTAYLMKFYNRIRKIAIEQEWINISFFEEELTEENCTGLDIIVVAATMMKAAIK